MDGHLTASAIVVSPDHSLVLLVHNRALNRFLAPGGHVDPGEMPAEAAQRELREETGLCAAPSGELPLDIDIHDIPARPSRGEGHHRHFDFRYLMTGNPKQKCQIDGHEIISAHWKPIYDIKQAYPRVYEALIRL